MVDQCANRRGQAAARCEDQMHDAALTTPTREHPDQSAREQRLAADVVRQQGDALVGNDGGASLLTDQLLPDRLRRCAA